MENKTYTIEELRYRKVAVENDGTINDLQKVLKAAFPNDNSFEYLLQIGFFKPNDKFMSKHKYHDKWYRNNLTDLPTQSVKLFLKEIEQMETKDNINPLHYKSKPKETIERIGDNLSLCEFKGYLKGNILKYLDRYENKNGMEDLKKANWYLNKLIEIETK